MEPRISIVTLGVEDLDRAVRFYEAMGWQGQEVEETVFFQAGGLAVVLWGRDKLAADAGLEDHSSPDAFRRCGLAHNVRTRDEVDAVLAAAVAAGGTITRLAEETFYGGYAGYFADPDGHLWEIGYNPGFTLADDGSLVLPDFA